MKQFKGKKLKKFKLFKIVIYSSIIFVSYIYTTHIIFNLKLKSSNEEFIISMLNNSNHHMIYEKQNKNLVNKFMKYVLNIDITNPKSMLKSVFNYQPKLESNTAENIVDPVLTEYINDPDTSIVNDPKVYIYNTHQLESYNMDNYAEYNITPNVQMASYLLKGLLNKDNIHTIVETANINDFLSLNGWNYNSSYKASRYYVEDTLKKNPNLQLIIDLHRDAIPREKSTVTIDGKNYAKVLFVIGTDYPGYEKNLELATKLNNLIKEQYPTLTRGVITKGGSGVNGVYNQDLSNKIILIECGGYDNTIDEVMNTIIVIKDVIKKYLGDTNG